MYQLSKIRPHCPEQNDCLNNVAVELFLMEQIAHDWPTDLNDYDIIAADEIWNFLKQFNINGRIAQ